MQEDKRCLYRKGRNRDRSERKVLCWHKKLFTQNYIQIENIKEFLVFNSHVPKPEHKNYLIFLRGESSSINNNIIFLVKIMQKNIVKQMLHIKQTNINNIYLNNEEIKGLLPNLF